MPASKEQVFGVQLDDGQPGAVAPATLLSVNWTAGCSPSSTQQELGTRSRLFVSPVKLVSTHDGTLDVIGLSTDVRTSSVEFASKLTSVPPPGPKTLNSAAVHHVFSVSRLGTDSV